MNFRMRALTIWFVLLLLAIIHQAGVYEDLPSFDWLSIVRRPTSLHGLDYNPSLQTFSRGCGIFIGQSLKEECSRELFVSFKGRYGEHVMSKKMEGVRLEVLVKIWLYNRFSAMRG